ncbi:hypothetical protein [Pontibacter sp. H249]|uniref:hypothetical protein n=1 Tax=Pontibacter sp. H249 TaxID=3133420 RepID=UPI0030C1A432
MRPRTLEKLLYKAAILLVIAGAFIRFIHAPDSNTGLYLILAGHAAGVAGILLYMKHANEQDRQHHNTETKQYENN